MPPWLERAGTPVEDMFAALTVDRASDQAVVCVGSNSPAIGVGGKEVPRGSPVRLDAGGRYRSHLPYPAFPFTNMLADGDLVLAGGIEVRRYAPDGALRWSAVSEQVGDAFGGFDDAVLGEDGALFLEGNIEGTMHFAGLTLTGSACPIQFSNSWPSGLVAKIAQDGTGEWGATFLDEWFSVLAYHAPAQLRVVGGDACTCPEVEGDACDHRVQVSAFDASGNRTWRTPVDGQFNAVGIDVDAAGTTFLALSQGDTLVVIAISASGVLAWSRKLAHLIAVAPRPLRVRPNGDVVVLANSNGPVDLGLGSPVQSGPKGDVVVLGLGSSGEYRWHLLGSSPDVPAASALDIGQDGTVYVGGTFTHQLSFGDLGPVLSAGGTDVFFAALTPP